MDSFPWEDMFVQDFSVQTLDQLPRTFYWASFLKNQIKNSKVNSWLQIAPPKGILFVGPEGNGKHTTAEALAASLHEGASKFEFVRINGADFDYETDLEVLTTVNELLQIADSGKKICILVDYLQGCRFEKKLQQFLAKKLYAKKDLNWMLVLIADQEEDVLPQLRRHLQLCRCTPPSLEERKIWLELCFEKPFPVITQDLDLDDLCMRTEGFSWHQLKEMGQYVRILIKQSLLAQFPSASQMEERQKALENGTVEIQRDDILLIVQKLDNRPPAEKEVIQYIPVPSTQTNVEAAVTETVPTETADIEKAPAITESRLKTMDELEQEQAPKKEEIKILQDPNKITTDLILGLKAIE